ncbi:MAG TPA: glycoside hydrolase family 16 protein [Mycobacteriales bacterium]|nr:glycoside hydrolase family 16 protein [Mycobacteriales bacterium]
MPSATSPPRRRWRIIAAGGFAAAAVTAMVVAVPSPAGAVPAPPAGYSLVFGDDFNSAAGTQPSTANWLYDTGFGYPGGATNWGTGEVERMTSDPANVSMDGAGHLAITPRRDAAGNWTSARIETQRTDFQPPAGGKLRIEASIQQPNVSGAAAAGYWPAFWSMGAPARPVGATNWPSIGEIDIMEDINGLSSVFGTLHCGPSIPGTCNETTGFGSGQVACPGCQTSFHTYGVEWDKSVTPETLRWYRDGAVYFSLNKNQVDAASWTAATNHGYFVILNVAMGGGFPAAFGGGPTAATQPNVPMLVDYVAIYSAGGGTVPPPTNPPPTTPPPTTPPPPGGTGAYGTIQAESSSAQSGTQLEATTDVGGGQNMGFIGNGDWAQYSNVNFSSTAAHQFVARVASGAAAGVSGLIEVRLDSRANAPVGSFAVGNTGGWQSWRSVPANITAVTGVHTVFLTFTSGQPADFVNVNWFTFGH